MHISQLSESKYLKKEDCGNGILLTIREIFQDEVENDGKTESVWCVSFDETEKPLILKPVNAQLIAAAVGSEETDTWIGQKIVAYKDPTVQMRGKVVGGIRVRAPRNQPAKAKTVAAPAAKPSPATSRQAPQPEPEAQPDDPGDDVPF